MLAQVTAPAGVRADFDPAATAGPREVERRDEVSRVWLTAESLGDEDPALAANSDLPAVFVFDETLLARLRLTGKRLVFPTECVATTFAPVPGWRRRSSLIEPDEIHPWPWLARPHAGPAGSFSAWRKRLERSKEH